MRSVEAVAVLALPVRSSEPVNFDAGRYRVALLVHAARRIEDALYASRVGRDAMRGRVSEAVDDRMQLAGRLVRVVSARPSGSVTVASRPSAP